ncbi:MAG: UMP kinase [Chloroflexi bacterium]|nr:UMP kinase [Chloroflexota bacterium]
MRELKYKRILLKLGGEALAGKGGFGIDPESARRVANTIKHICSLGVQTAILIGGGNVWRGKDGAALGMDRVPADHIGMLATVMNALALQDALNQFDVPSRVQTAIEMRSVAEPYIRGRAIRHLEKGRVVIFGAGTGNPYFTTDTAGALRANEIKADVFIKATKVDAIYAEDPRINPNAQRFEQMSYMDALNLRVGVMDVTAISLCMEHQMPIIVVDLWEPGSVDKVVFGEKIGTLVC